MKPLIIGCFVALVANLVCAEDNKAVGELRKEADAGNCNSQVNLGLMYAKGDNVPKDEAEAAKWFRMAADQGHAAAQNNLGWMYANGNGVAKDDVEAVRWYRLAAEKGHASAQNNLGWMYDEGHGVPQDRAEAVKWYSLAAAQGHVAAQNNLGSMYANGVGVRMNFVQAHIWWSMAKAKGSEAAEFNLEQLEKYMTSEQKAEATKLAQEKFVQNEKWKNEAQASLWTGSKGWRGSAGRVWRSFGAHPSPGWRALPSSHRNRYGRFSGCNCPYCNVPSFYFTSTGNRKR
jgi:TPR repeat protein